MVPPRVVSLWKNQLISPEKRDQWHSELPVATDLAESCSALKTSYTHAVAPRPGQAVFTAIELASAGKKHAQQAPTLSTSRSSKRIADFDISPFYDGKLAISSEGGEITVSSIDWSALQERDSRTLPGQSTASSLQWHPVVSDLLLATSQESVTIWNVSTQSSEIKLPAPTKGFWSSCWSADGRLVAATTKANTVQLWDPRQDATAPIHEANGHQGIKASRVAWVNENQLVTTGVSKMRDRELFVWDIRNFDKPVKTLRVDSNSGPLTPLVDHSRGLVYLAGRGDMYLRWVEVTPDLTMTEGQTAVPSPILGAALAPAHVSNPMKTEINRLVFSSKESLIYNASVTVPRRQMLDFHTELFPPVADNQPALPASKWLAGEDATPLSVPVGPEGPQYAIQGRTARVSQSHQPTATPVAVPPPQPVSSHQVKAEPPTASTTAPAPAPAAAPNSKPTSVSATPQGQAQAPSPSPAQRHAVTRDLPDSQNQPTATRPLEPSTNAPSVQTNKKVLDTHWSRAYLIGKTPIKPAFEGLSGLSATSSPDQPMLRCNAQLLAFPLSGGGGRLAVHPMKKLGRLPAVIPGLVCGSPLTTFELDPFHSQRVAIACEDGKIRVFNVPENGLSEDSGESAALLGDSGMDKVSQLTMHPTAEHLLASVSEDGGDPSLRLWDLSTGHLVVIYKLSGRGVFHASWSPDGSRIALACKDRKLRVLDPRKPDSATEGASHDSPRPVHPIWLDDSHLLTTGFSKAASREVQIFRVDSNEIRPVAKKTLEVSPAALFPHYDRDTGILFLHSKGERICQSFEIRLEQSPPTLAKLPAYEHGTLQLSMDFLPKQHCDTSAVEVAVAYRLTEHTIQRVGFCIPRARVELFQDDVYPPTRDVERPAMSIEEWMAGENKVHPAIDLNKEQRPLLSDAPAPKATVSTRNKIAAGPGKTDQDRAQEGMDDLWSKAQQDGADSSSDEDVPASGRVPEDDDW